MYLLVNKKSLKERTEGIFLNIIIIILSHYFQKYENIKYKFSFYK